jgi:putative membrane protein
MKRNAFFLAAISSAFIFSACNNSSDSTTTTDSSTTSTSTPTVTDGTSTMDTTSSTTASTTPLDEMDKGFVMKAASGGVMEVELGNIAQTNASSQRVKDFGAMMVRDHSNANNELMAMASRRGLMLNADSLKDVHKSHIAMMQKKTGAAFDKAYMDMMVGDHKKDVAEFEKASKMCKDQECLGFASKTLPVLQTHLDSAQAIHKSLK